jgi:hypothetical protein
MKYYIFPLHMNLLQTYLFDGTTECEQTLKPVVSECELS